MGLIPMFHGYGLLLNCICMSLGTKLIVLKYFSDELFLKSIDMYKVSIYYCMHKLISHIKSINNKKCFFFYYLDYSFKCCTSTHGISC